MTRYTNLKGVGKFTIWFNTVLLLTTAVFISCQSPLDSDRNENIAINKNNEINVTIESEHFIASIPDGKILMMEDGGAYTTFDTAGWISFDVTMPVAGRYRVAVLASNTTNKPVVCWVEDYIDNKDSRTYNITGNITLPGSASAFNWYHKDGSPMNKGLHKIKVHFNNPLNIDKLRFTLLNEHKKTPRLLTQQTKGKKWKEVWSDEFNGTTIDTAKWSFDIGDWGWGNNELQYYTNNKKENARVENGHLIIEAHKNTTGNGWTSARLTTRGKESFLYGRIEFKAMVPSNRGNWSAGWILGDSYIDELSWPYCGEIDILESVGYEMDDNTGDGTAHASVHCGAYYFKLGNQPTSTLKVKNMNHQFHTYAMEWTPENIKVFVDSTHYFTYEDTSTELSWPFNKPQNIILNLAMGGGWGGLQGVDPSITSQQMLIDYVKVYALE